jgi:stalled ribosome alternative rescue factor ArfA
LIAEVEQVVRERQEKKKEGMGSEHLSQAQKDPIFK